MKDNTLYSDLPQPEGKGRLSVAEILNGSPVTPIQRVNLMSPDEYEDFVLEWAHAYLGKRYIKVRRFGGAGDKGRDIVGYINEEGYIDIYQCKHYNAAITPTVLFTELGKLCYHTFNNSYRVPRNYVIVAPQGVGSSVLDLITNPKTINQNLIDAWEKNCKNKITSTEAVELTGDFLKYVQEFDFSIIKDKAPHEIISEHATTIYHARRFGGGLKRYREFIPAADDDIQPRELVYTTQLFEVYSEDLGKPISCSDTLKEEDSEHFETFCRQRNSFYCAESLEIFSRENFADLNPLPFDELKGEAKSVIDVSLSINRSETGYYRLMDATREVQRHTFNSNPLSAVNEIKVEDKEGLCHHLANEKKIRWIRKK